MKHNTTEDHDLTQRHSLKSINYAINGQQGPENEIQNNIKTVQPKQNARLTQEKRLEEILGKTSSMAKYQKKPYHQTLSRAFTTTNQTSSTVLPEITSLYKKNTIYKKQSSKEEQRLDAQI